jgi:hypothetical protein
MPALKEGQQGGLPLVGPAGKGGGASGGGVIAEPAGEDVVAEGGGEGVRAGGGGGRLFGKIKELVGGRE